MSIKITNDRLTEVQVAVSYWETDGKPGNVSDIYYTLKAGHGDEWGRNDARGYLMDIKGTGIYYVAFNSQISIEDKVVKNNGTPITQLSLKN